MSDSFRIKIAGSWDAVEFAELFADVTATYNFCFLEEYGPADEFMYRILRSGLLSPRRFERYVSMVSRDSFGLANFLPSVISNEIGALLNNNDQQLRVRRINFESPGFVDLLGAGKAIGHLRKFVEGIIDRIIEREDRELDRAEKREDILAKKIKNAEAILKLADRYPLDEETKSSIMRELLRIDASIERKLIAGKITGSTDGE